MYDGKIVVSIYLYRSTTATHIQYEKEGSSDRIKFIRHPNAAPLSQHPHQTRKNRLICSNYGLITGSRIPQEKNFGLFSLTRKR